MTPGLTLRAHHRFSTLCRKHAASEFHPCGRITADFVSWMQKPEAGRGGWCQDTRSWHCSRVMWLDNAQSTEAPVTSAYCAAKMAFGDIVFLLSFGAPAILPQPPRAKTLWRMTTTAARPEA